MSESVAVDLNADLGEGFGRWSLASDLDLLEVITSASIACGFHAGDPLIMMACARGAVERGVTIGAHVSYLDLRGFGRRYIDVDPDELVADVLYQLGALAGIARAAGADVRYVKPHGALYNTVVVDERHASAVVRAVRSFDPALPVFTMAGSVLDGLAQEAGLRTVSEAFADRAYTPEGRLADRRHPGSVRHGAEAVARAAISIVCEGRSTTISGEPVPVRGETLCLHGDTPDAVHHARAVREALETAGVTIRAAC